MTQLSFSDVGVDFGATTLFSRITFTVAAGERWGIVGRNGTGKTTLFRLLTGAMKPTRGAIARQPNIRISLLEQHRDFGDVASVWEAAAGELAELLALEQSLEEQAHALANDSSDSAMEKYGHDLERFEREGGYGVAARIDSVLHGLGFDPEKARTTAVSTLSGGERGRVGLARQLASNADVLLLDEPTNHLDLETTRWLEDFLKGIGRTVIVISHDRAFLDAVADHVLHFEGDSATPYSGGYKAFVAQRTERRLTQQRAFEQQQRKIASETDYIARNLAGQNTKQAKGRRKMLARLPRLSEPIGADGTMAVRFDVAERGGDRVVSAVNATIRVENRTLVEKCTATLMRGDVLGLIGPNGAGKSTFLKALFGDHPLASGELKLGGSISAAFYRQDLSQVPMGTTLYDIINELRPTWERRFIQGHLGRFGFSGDEVQRQADTLSGGERARVALAMLMLSRSNLLVLDEPTNHLDVESIEVLEDAIEDYEGTVLLVSHDRELLRALTTRVWILHDRHITDFDGGFAEWESVSAERAHAASVRAAEEEQVRRVKERKKVEPRREETGARARAERLPSSAAKGSERDDRRTHRAAQAELERAEARITELEGKIAKVSSALEDPELYTKTGGVEQAATLGRDLESLKRELDAAMAIWAAAAEG